MASFRFGALMLTRFRVSRSRRLPHQSENQTCLYSVDLLIVKGLFQSLDVVTFFGSITIKSRGTTVFHYYRTLVWF